MFRRLVFGFTAVLLLSALSGLGGSPQASAAARPVPVLGRPVGTFFEARGFGQVRPTLIDNGGDPTGRVTGIRWQTWGGPRAIGTGTGWVPGQSVAQGSAHKATVVAFNLGRCAGKLRYEAVTWYFPDQGESFDPKMYEDICTGQYVDLTCLSYRQATQVFFQTHQSPGASINDVICDGSAWATGFVTGKNHGSSGSAAFHLTTAGWTLVAVSYGRTTVPPSPSVAKYCKALVQAQAPADMQCDSTLQG
jgi:hypothetical protein